MEELQLEVERRVVEALTPGPGGGAPLPYRPTDDPLVLFLFFSARLLFFSVSYRFFFFFFFFF